MGQWLAQRSFTEVICLLGCLAVSMAVIIGAIRGRSGGEE